MIFINDLYKLTSLLGKINITNFEKGVTRHLQKRPKYNLQMMPIFSNFKFNRKKSKMENSIYSIRMIF